MAAWSATRNDDGPESHRWRATRRGEQHGLTTLDVRLLPDGHLAVKAYGRPVAGGRANYVSLPVPEVHPHHLVAAPVL